MHEEHWVKVVVLLVFFVLVTFGVAVLHRISRKERQQRFEDHKKEIAKGVELGVMNEHGESLCVVCGAIAKHPTLVIGRAWFDRIPILSSLNRLYAMPWRYSVVDDWTRGLRLCDRHHDTGRERLEEVLATMRAEHARFNSTQQEKVQVLAQGGLEQLLIEDVERIRKGFGLRGKLRRVMSNGSDDDDVHVLPLRTTDGDEL